MQNNLNILSNSHSEDEGEKGHLPSNLNAEQALLGAILLDNEIINSVCEYLLSIHFAHPAHGCIYDAILKLHDRGIVVDPITLTEYMSREKEILNTVGGTSYIVSLVENVFLISGAKEYGRVIYNAYLRRELIHVSHEIIDNATNKEIDPETQIEEAEKSLYNLAMQGRGNNKIYSFVNAISKSIEMVESAFKKNNKIVGITTGLKKLDDWLGGLHRSDLLILAGRPSMGKTALATNIAFNAAKALLNNPEDGGKVLFFSLEMSAEQLSTRILSTETGIPSNLIRKGQITTKDFEKFLEVARNLQDLPLNIDDTPGINIVSIRNRARRLKRQSGLDLIIVDYLQLVDGNDKDNRVQEISKITRSLKAIAKELNVPVLALSQLSRAVEQREDKRPQLSDLRESGSIEQDADVVMFVYREEYYLERAEPRTDTQKYAEWQKRMEDAHQKADVVIAKQRHGPVGTIKLFFDGNLTRFGNLSDRLRD